MSAPDPVHLPGLPRDVDGPVFGAPWEAQAFAMAVRLHEEGAFTWTEWAAALSQELAGAPPTDGSGYYACWLAALERLAVDRGLTDPPELLRRKDDWARAYERTPHGRPVEL